MKSQIPTCRVAAGFALAVLLACAPVAWSATHTVSTVSQLEYWAFQCAPNDEIVINPGTYEMTKCLYMSNKAGVTVRGATGNPEDVILTGGGMNNVNAIRECFQFVSPNMTLKDLTIEGYYHHAIHFQPAGDQCTVDNVITRNNGEQHMKGAVNNDDCVIMNCLMIQTEDRLNGLPDRPDNYVGGIDLHGARNCQIHDNVIIDIIGMGDAGDGGIFLWNASQNCTIERNVVIGCCKGIELGNPSDQGLWQVQNSIVRNNFVLREPGDDIGIELCYTLGCDVYNNTVYSTSPTPDNDWNRTIHIYDNAAHPTTDLDIRNNIIRGGVRDNSTGDWSSAAVAAMGNIVDTAGTLVLPEWFVDPDNLDLHLTEAALAAIDAAVVLADVPEDIDGGLRGALPDMGADEFGSPAGDANYDGRVDGADYTIWADHYLMAGNWGDGDFNSTGVVDGADYTIWADNYGYGVSAGAAMPEPATLALLAGGLALTGAVRRRRVA